MADARGNIPSPPGLPFLGNILDVQDEVPIRAMEHLADVYGPIFKLNLMGRERITIASAALLDELMDEKRFWKTPGDGLNSAQPSKTANDNTSCPIHSGRGLFSAPSEDDLDWQQAHRTLMPAFGPLAIQRMFPEMHDVASQLVLKWARMGPSFRIPVTSDFTRVTLDTIALCAMDYRFNSFYQDEMHPFVQSMTASLSAASDRLQISTIVRKMIPWDRSSEKIAADRQYMRQVSQELIQVRIDNPTDKPDLLNALIHGKDPKTGETLPKKLVVANMITFLIAGHETTSGLLSFAFLLLLLNPEKYFKAQQEVDRIVGRGKITPEHLKDLEYINAVLRETLRLHPTAPAFSRSIRNDNPNDTEYIAEGQFALKRSDKVLCLMSKIHRDPEVYGEDANEFRPERMYGEAFREIPESAWKPFGAGVRACIGRAFALQEAQLVMAMLLQNFNFRLDDPNYEMKVKQTLTLKPEGFYMRASLREGIAATSLQAALSSTESAVNAKLDARIKRNDSGLEYGKPMTILYGSNTGTCQSLAQRLSSQARKYGFRADAKELDAGVGLLPKEQPVVIITASYEGQPPDNAGQFVKWLEMLDCDANEVKDVSFAVFGCGNSDWINTFQRIPTLVDSLLEQHGGKRIVKRGFANAAVGDIVAEFDNWSDNSLWPAMSPSAAPEQGGSSLEIEMSTQNRSSYLRHDVQKGKVLKSTRLTATDHPEKRHLEAKLPEGMTYQTGDYLAILPLNPTENVSRIMKHFDIPSDATITIKPDSPTFLPTGVSLSVSDLLKGFVELGQPATKRDLEACINSIEDHADKAALDIFKEPAFFQNMTEQRVSLMDLLAKYEPINLSFGTFLSMLPPLCPRHYSISSSPLADQSACTVTYSVIDEVSKSGVGRHIGITGHYLSQLSAGDEILVSVRSTNQFFHLPTETSKTPIMMFGAGTGIAPFRGFIQERAIQIAAGRQLAPALMFMGCRSAREDRLYASEMDQWAESGAVDIRYSFSREPEKSQGCKYIQDRLRKDREDVLQMWRDGAKVFTCGGTVVSEQVSKFGHELLLESQAKKGKKMTEEEVARWFRERRNVRYVVDVFD